MLAEENTVFDMYEIFMSAPHPLLFLSALSVWEPACLLSTDALRHAIVRNTVTWLFVCLAKSTRVFSTGNKPPALQM